MKLFFCISSMVLLAIFRLCAEPPQIFWGQETNYLKCGLTVETLHDDQNTIRLFPLLFCSSTNAGGFVAGHLIVDLPYTVESRYRMDLTDDKGNVIAKTSKGKALGKSEPHFYKPRPNFITGVTSDTGWRPDRYLLLLNEARAVGPPLLLSDYFKITKPGKYHLHFEMFVFKPRIHEINKEDLILFPPVEADIKIEPIADQ